MIQAPFLASLEEKKDCKQAECVRGSKDYKSR